MRWHSNSPQREIYHYVAIKEKNKTENKLLFIINYNKESRQKSSMSINFETNPNTSRNQVENKQ